ncbi:MULTISPECIES: DUF177 domain-containing protein [unclassified Rhodosalinus]|uniref:YceD family protein n=1 Tax=unclassified Rhodosalinus TaxID=2630183 RepID=UPI0035231E2C
MTDPSRPSDPSPRILRLAELPQDAPTAFALEPDAGTRAALAETLGIDAIRKLRFTGTLAPEGRSDWHLEGVLGATVVQPCVVTLAPVATRIDTTVTRRYLAGFDMPETVAEVEMPEDVTSEPLPERVDLMAVMTEALALSLPDYPRAPGVELGTAQAAPPGVAPLSDEELKPFAGLQGLRDKLRRDS